jgi:hypothetical protein
MGAHIQITGPGRLACAVVTLLLGLACGLVFAVGGSLVLAAAPAFAAPPEIPLTIEPATEITATTAKLEGTLNPLKRGEEGTYEFAYEQSATECAAGLVAPEPPGGTMTGAEKQAVSAPVTGLQPNAQYTFCLVATNKAAESAAGSAVTFKTLAAKPAFESESFNEFTLTQTEATLEAQINPNNQATTCKFEYGTSATLSGAVSVPCEPATLEGFPGQHASAHLAGLSPNTVYYYRVAVENGAGPAEGVPIQKLETAPPPPTATTGEASMVTAISATIMGTVNPGSSGPNSEATYFFEYSTSATPGVFECNEPTCHFVPSLSPGGGAGQGTSDVPETAALTGLRPLKTYRYRIVAYNGSFLHAFFGGGAVFGSEREFKTLPLAPGAKTDPPVTVGSSSAKLAGEVVSNEAPTTYSFTYGTTTAYGSSAPSPVGQLSGVSTGQYVTTSVEGLQPDTTYHYVLVAANSGGKGEGDDQTFITNAAGEPGSGPLPPGFSLTGPAPAGPGALVYPNLTGLGAVPQPKITTPPASKPLTRAQKLSKALKACKKDKPKSKRTACEKQARKRYGPLAKRKS